MLLVVGRARPRATTKMHCIPGSYQGGIDMHRKMRSNGEDLRGKRLRWVIALVLVSQSITGDIMGKRERVSCKKVLDQTICKVGSAIVLPKQPITVRVYNSSDCGWCDKEINKFIKHAKNLSGFIKPIVTDIEDSSIDVNSIGVLPVADFGNGVVEKGRLSKLGERDMIADAMESIRNADLVRSFHGE
jgi:hypothetical protein